MFGSFYIFKLVREKKALGLTYPGRQIIKLLLIVKTTINNNFYFRKNLNILSPLKYQIKND
ncbi:hypothetical protein GCM10007422_00450 [Pedobacter zeae]|uniref:Uncharacterized protein n=1 Tax=Pedobacter zeae TaxID=1737356 RepID=A0ABQ1XDQ1_9SPHI|nr:hypothetical protein GCM10007422_00450 [Pedobacter zeae]